MMDAKSIEYLLRKIHTAATSWDVAAVVDKSGLDGLVDDACQAVFITGASAGFGGAATTVVLGTVDISNFILQQMRIAMGLIYERTGQVDPSFEQVTAIMLIGFGFAGGLGVKAVAVTAGREAASKLLAKEIAKRLPAWTIGKAVPFVGAVIGGVTNYAFMYGYAETLMAISDELFEEGGAISAISA